MSDGKRVGETGAQYRERLANIVDTVNVEFGLPAETEDEQSQLYKVPFKYVLAEKPKPRRLVKKPAKKLVTRSVHKKAARKK